MQRLRHLVVIIPGIGGSVLSGPGGTAWATTTTRLAGALVQPGRLDLTRTPDLRPTALISTFTALGGLLHLQGYDGLEGHLRSSFRSPVVHTHRHGVPVPGNVDVLLFPYDFRRSVRTWAEALAGAVGQALAGITGSARHRRVIVIAHSMGGLVARYWLGPLGGAPACAALFTLGTPHRGAPKALDWLVNGAGVGRLRLPWVTRVLRGWPSVYELLPQYPAVWHAEAGRELELTELPAAAGPYRATFASMAADGRRVHDEIAAAWAAIAPTELPVVPYFGRGHPTGNRMELTGSGRLTIAKADPEWRGNVGWFGDGTVPAVSAIPRELGEHRAAWRGVRERHGDLAGTAAVLDLLTSYTGESLPTRGERPDRPWLGLDVEDVVPSGAPTPVSVIVHARDGAEAAHLSLTGVGNPAGPRIELPLASAGESWRGVLPPLAEGRYRLVVEAQRVGGPESLFARADLTVLDADEAEPE